MPLNRDKQIKHEITKSAADYVTDRQQTRSNAPDSVDANGSVTPQVVADGEPGTRGRRHSLNANVPNASKKFTISDARPELPINMFQSHKIAVPNTMAPPHNIKHQQSVPHTKHEISQQMQQKPKIGTKEKKSQAQIQRTNVFDDTASFDQSMFDDSSYRDNENATYQSQLHALKQHAEQTEITTDHNDDHTNAGLDTEDVLHQLGVGSNWRQEVDEERAYQARKHSHTPDMKHANLAFDSHAILHNDGAGRAFEDLSGQPETPSRVRSVPPVQSKMHAPVARKGITFARSPEIFDAMAESPDFRSSEMARENSPTLSSSRPHSTQPLPLHMAIHQKAQSNQPNVHSRLRRSHPAHAAHTSRFQRVDEQRNRMMQPEQKVSAPESDIQESSEDERAQTRLVRPEVASMMHEEFSQVAGKKRPLEDDHVLDYDAEVLKGKKLADLRNEPFTVDPRSPLRQTALDSHGNEMSLNQMLDNLSKITSKQQRETFHGQTDEEWAQTGQWFVDRFQADLKALMEVRLNRRMMALRYEDQIARRQRAVEHQQLGVEKELKELQQGGTGLLKDRKATGGSRASTPMKPVR